MQLDERASEKAARAPVDAAARMNNLLREFDKRTAAAEQRELVAALEEKRVPGTDELDVLQQIMEQQRRRQGIV